MPVSALHHPDADAVETNLNEPVEIVRSEFGKRNAQSTGHIALSTRKIQLCILMYYHRTTIF